MSALLFGLSLSLPVLVLAGARWGGIYLWLTPLLAWVIHPLLDSISGWDCRSTLPPKSRGRAILHSLLPWTALPLLAAVLAYCLSHPGAHPVWLAINLGIYAGSGGIPAAHELVHRRSGFERGLGTAILSLVCYLPYRIEHVLGHHPNVGRYDDPASARLGESLYHFWFRSIVDGHRSAWRIDRPRMLRYGALQALVLTGVASLWGAIALGMFLLQSFVAVLFLETVNYIEHYGLSRGNEKISARHSWDSGHRWTNWMLFNLGRHAHHHLHPSARYEDLHGSEGAPRLPGGYSTLLWLALVPPLWRRVMDPRANML